MEKGKQILFVLPGLLLRPSQLYASDECAVCGRLSRVVARALIKAEHEEDDFNSICGPRTCWRDPTPRIRSCTIQAVSYEPHADALPSPIPAFSASLCSCAFQSRKRCTSLLACCSFLLLFRR
ncbi:hypothetical protein KSP39_PZI011328 [Platanthera zijinensis]|uniref:Secreted protein n=1 Tax=Platanthera zijinensis TaxID=2320716 RepID=A0AAP0G663_9ASPA